MGRNIQFAIIFVKFVRSTMQLRTCHSRSAGSLPPKTRARSAQTLGGESPLLRDRLPRQAAGRYSREQGDVRTCEDRAADSRQRVVSSVLAISDAEIHPSPILQTPTHGLVEQPQARSICLRHRPYDHAREPRAPARGL